MVELLPEMKREGYKLVMIEGTPIAFRGGDIRYQFKEVVYSGRSEKWPFGELPTDAQSFIRVWRRLMM